MTTQLLTNPKGAGYFNYCPDNGAFYHEIVVDPEVENPLPLGTAVELEGYSGPGEDNPPTYPLVEPTSTTADSLGVGIVVGGQSANSNDGTSVPPGDIALIMSKGICQVLFDADSTKGDVLVQSAATAGCLKTITPADTNIPSELFGVCLETVTVEEDTTALVWCYVNKVS